jgi:hypothetical protein
MTALAASKPTPTQEGPKENAPPRAPCSTSSPARAEALPRSLADPLAAAAVLRPLSADRAAQLGVRVEAAPEAEGSVSEAEAEAAGTAPEARRTPLMPREAAAAAAAALTSPSRRALRSLFQE